MFDRNTTTEVLLIRLTERLNGLPVGEIITHHQMRQIVGEDRAYLVQQARKRANRESGAIFESVRGVGLRRMPDGEAHAVGKTALRRARNTTNRASGMIVNTVTKSNSISDTDTIRAYATLNVLGLVGRQTHLRNVDMKEAEIRSQHSSSAEAARASLEAMRAHLRRSK